MQIEELPLREQEKLKERITKSIIMAKSKLKDLPEVNVSDNFYSFLSSFDWSTVAIDKCHAQMLYGFITSTKPESVLEMGIGSGFITKTILHGLSYNKKGRLTSIDSWYDWYNKKGRIVGDWDDWKENEPEHIQELRDMGCNVIAPIFEEVFVKMAAEYTYDIVVADGDHRHGGLWAEQVYDLVSDNGALFAHDVCMEDYPTLRRFVEIAKERGYFYHIFNKNSLPNEACNRGFLMVIKN